MIMKAKITAVLIGCAAGWTVAAGSPNIAAAQVDCEIFPAGPARTDCYIGLSRIGRQKSNIAATVARQQADAAKVGALTGTSPKQIAKKKRRATAAR